MCSIECQNIYIRPHCSECIKGSSGEGYTERCVPGLVDGVCLSNGIFAVACKSDKYIGDGNFSAGQDKLV